MADSVKCSKPFEIKGRRFEAAHLVADDALPDREIARRVGISERSLNWDGQVQGPREFRVQGDGTDQPDNPRGGILRAWIL